MRVGRYDIDIEWYFPFYQWGWGRYISADAHGVQYVFNLGPLLIAVFKWGKKEWREEIR